MPKGRHLKPDFFTDKHIVSVSPLARLLYQGLWCYAADCGHLDDEPLELKMRILPADNCDVEELLGELVNAGRITRCDGVIHLPKLSDHARVDKRYETRCDDCKARGDHDGGGTPQTPRPSVTTTGPQRGHVGTTRPQPTHHDADGDGDGDGDVSRLRVVGSLTGQLSTGGLTDDDLDQIANKTGGGRDHARAVAADVLERAGSQVRKPLPYILRAIRSEPERHAYRGPRTKEHECPQHPGYPPPPHCGAHRSTELAGGAR